MSYLSDFLHVVILIHTESFDGHWLIVINAFPNIAETAIGDRELGRLDEFLRYNVGSGE